MPNILLTESIAFELGASEPWPEDVRLYQPYETEQILINDIASSLTVKAFMKMCGLQIQVEMRGNAEDMSPNGKLPFIKCGQFVIADLDPIVSFVFSKGISLTDHLDASQKADMRAYMSLVNNILGNAELYVSWLDNSTFTEITKPRYGSVYPWPLKHVLTWQKQREIKKRLTAFGWAQKSLDEVYNEVDNCCHALSERLGNKKFFFNDRPTELDALVFGHVFTLLTTSMPENSLASIVRSHSGLIALVKTIEDRYFKDPEVTRT
ncbi:metaxin-2-like [Artemia franciscana]|uniref:Metaxin-2 n=1 Tax=Artemia franciscana TaxID=6661 RepID=A0AA88H6I3_ARTSF|nr:hypothetical protein QYM36_018608 [Artemia franciscana]